MTPSSSREFGRTEFMEAALKTNVLTFSGTGSPAAPTTTYFYPVVRVRTVVNCRNLLELT